MPESSLPRHAGRRVALVALLVASASLAAPATAQAPLPIFDAHLHYSHDAWERLPPRQAVALLRQAGLKRALVSSSSDEGTQMLYAEAPDLVLPSLRPYRSRGEIGTWVNDASIVPHLESRLKQYRYVAIGEYHVYGADADLPVVRRVVELAREYKLFLHSHSDADAIERQFRQDPDARILWAHSGFESPDRIRELLRRHPRLWCDLAFLVGTDTFTPERWHFVVEHARWSRQWLADLPPAVAERIAWKNGEALFGSMLTPRAP